MNLFIDTNVFLSFYHLTSDDLEELNKLVILLREKKIILLLSRQVIEEFFRNRESKISDSLKRLREQRLNLQFPQICKDYKEYKNMCRLQKAYEDNHTDLIKKISKDVKNSELIADKTINDLFDLANKIELDENILNKARLRVDIGNPPGKNKSLGDAINWESLLNTVQNEEDLHFITDDKDYYSPLDDTLFNGFLLREWAEEKNSNIYYYKRISNFFKEHFPDIKLASELEKDLLIKELRNSGSFDQTHSIIAKIRKYSDFTPSQLNEIVAAALSNNQIYWIIEDWDVNSFLSDITKNNEDKIDVTNLEELNELLEPSDSKEDIDLPF